jgi:uncharacterized protein
LILIDTSGLLAALFPDQNHHEECARALLEAEPPRILSPFVLAELDYLILKHAGIEAELALIAEIDRGVYQIPEVHRLEWRDIEIMLERYADLRIGLADASLIIFGDRYQTNEVLTLDQRHFRAMRPTTFGSFRILPFDPEPPPKIMPVPGRSRTRRAVRR